MRNNLYLIGFGLILGLFMAAAILLLLEQPQQTPVVLQTAVPRTVRFEIYGAVAEPGIYESEDELRVEEAVQIAGGFTAEADTQNSHRSGWVGDGSVVVIPTLSVAEPTLTPMVRGGLKINLNEADAEALTNLPGIGEKKAADILALRESLGSFTAVEDLLQIQGIGESTLEKFYDMVTVR